VGGITPSIYLLKKKRKNKKQKGEKLK